MPDYKTTLNTPIQLGDALGADHLARFVVEIISQLDLSKIYGGYADSNSKFKKSRENMIMFCDYDKTRP